MVSSVVSQRGDATNPAPREQLLDKFRALAGPTLGLEKAGLVIDAAGRLDSLENIGEFSVLLSAVG